MEKIRKRSFTNYQIQQEKQQLLLNQILAQKIQRKIQTPKPQSKQNKFFYGIKAKKAKIFGKYQDKQNKTSRINTQQCNISTIQSLKRQIKAIQRDQIMSYRLMETKKQVTNSSEDKSNEALTTIQCFMNKLKQLKKNQLMADKFRTSMFKLKFHQLRNQTLYNPERSSIKHDVSSVKSAKYLTKQQKLGSHVRNGDKIIAQKQRYISEKSRNQMSLSARRFYERKNTNTRARTQSSVGLYERQNTIKKIKIIDRVFSSSLLSV